MRKSVLSICTLLVVISMLLAACATPTVTPAASQVPPATQTPATEAPTATTAATNAATVEPTTTHASDTIILATTTSTRDSGLLDVLLPLFEKATGYKVKMVAVGSGAALKLGQDGNADVLLVHSPAAEQTYMDGGFGKERVLVMHNDFIIVGPASDPAKISGSASAVDAFKAIAAAQATFVSRDDASGTNAKELAIWKSAGITPSGDWYVKTGQGMGDTLQIANQKAGYTLSDRATFLSLKSNLDLTILYQGEKSLLNIYHVITVNPDLHPNINYAGAKAFADWIVSADVQKVIASYGIDKYGEQLFFPDAGKSEDAVK